MHGDGVQDAESFLSRWCQARRLMHREGLLAYDPDAERARMLQAGVNPAFVEHIIAPAVAERQR